MRTRFVPGTVTGQQDWGEVQGLVYLRAGLGVASEKAHSPKLLLEICAHKVCECVYKYMWGVHLLTPKGTGFS